MSYTTPTYGATQTYSDRLTKHRTLIECKDYDVSGDLIGLEVVDKFTAVVHDVRPDEAWIVSCNGFTKNAIKAAKHENIKLVILRKFKDEDWEGRIRRIGINMTIKGDLNHKITFDTLPEDQESFKNDALLPRESMRFEVGKSGYSLTTQDGKISDIAEWLQEQRKHFDVLNAEAGHYEAIFDVPNALIVVNESRPYPIQRIMVEYDISAIETNIVVESDKIATLLVKGLGDDDMIIWDEDLRRYDIDADGNVVQKPLA